MRKAVRGFSAEDEVRILGRYIHFRQRLDLPRLYNHPRRAQCYRVGDRWHTLQQLERWVARLESGERAAA